MSSLQTSLMALAVLGLFALAATNFDVTARAGMGISGNVMVLVASLVVFRDFGFFLGPVIVGCFGALDWTQLRERAWPKIAFNASADAVSLLAATLVFWSITTQPVAGSTARLFIAYCTWLLRPTFWCTRRSSASRSR